MVDHSLDHGWDMARGGLYDEGYYLPGTAGVTIIKDTKTWWAQAEALNSLLLMAELFPDEAWRYFGHFIQLWDYTTTYLIDAENGGWYAGGLDKQPEYRTGLKAHIWKAAYHDGRTLMNLTHRLKTALGEDRQFIQPAGATP
jgi:mannobiose 2-epimerase